MRVESCTIELISQGRHSVRLPLLQFVEDNFSWPTLPYLNKGVSLQTGREDYVTHLLSILRLFSALLRCRPDYMVSFTPGWNFSPANRDEISDRLLKQILWKPSCRLHGEGFSPGWKIHVIAIIFSARAEKGARACVSVVFSHLSKLSHGNLRFAPGLKLSM